MRKLFVFSTIFLMNGLFSRGSLGQVSPQESRLILGADVSGLVSPQARTATNPSNAPTSRRASYQANGKPDSEINIMARHGWNAFRLRVFVSPVRSAPNNSLENTIVLARQIKAAGATFLLDIHYSDTWADPQHQETPIAWRDLDADSLAQKVDDYSRDVITRLRDAGVMPDMVQVGNETTGGMLWPLGHVQVPPSTIKLDAGKIQPLPDPYIDEKQWLNFTSFLRAGIHGVHAGAGASPVKIVMHIDCGGDWPITQWYFDHLTLARVDYDIIGQSYYPRYHGTLDELQQNIANCDRAYHKPVMVVETGYPQDGGDRLSSYSKYMTWPGTPLGQAQFMADLITSVKHTPNGIGVFYWAPEPFGRGNGLWNRDGTPAPGLLVGDSAATRPS